MRGRSDIYVGFIERGLDLLKVGGALGFICADRWMKNQYGRALRQLISESYAVDTVLTMHDVDAFEEEVSAYPAVVILRNGPQQAAILADTSGAFDRDDATKLSSWVRTSHSSAMTTSTVVASRLPGWYQGGDLWPSGDRATLALVADMEARFPPLEDPRTATRVGIGVATGCDQVYITPHTELVEEDRLLPLLRAADTTTGTLDWSGGYLVNPWDEDGLVDLDHYPLLAR